MGSGGAVENKRDGRELSSSLRSPLLSLLSPLIFPSLPILHPSECRCRARMVALVVATCLERGGHGFAAVLRCGFQALSVQAKKGAFSAAGWLMD